MRVREIAARLPAAWAGIKEYDRSFSLEGEAPEVRLSAERIEQLRSALEVAEDVVSEVRELARFPRGSVDGVRPKVERLEQVGNLNAYVDVNFPYDEHLHRVLFLLWLDAKLQTEAGDVETALVDLRAMVNAGRSVGDYPGLSAQMSRRRVLASDSMPRNTLAQGQAAGPSLADLQSILEDESKLPARSIALRGERAIIDDLFEQIVAGKLSPSAIPYFNDYPFWAKAFSHRINIRENQATLLRLHTRAVEETRLPESEQLAAMKARTMSGSPRRFNGVFWRNSAGSPKGCCWEGRRAWRCGWESTTPCFARPPPPWPPSAFASITDDGQIRWINWSRSTFPRSRAIRSSTLRSSSRRSPRGYSFIRSGTTARTTAASSIPRSPLRLVPTQGFACWTSVAGGRRLRRPIQTRYPEPRRCARQCMVPTGAARVPLPPCQRFFRVGLFDISGSENRARTRTATAPAGRFSRP